MRDRVRGVIATLIAATAVCACTTPVVRALKPPKITLQPPTTICEVDNRPCEIPVQVELADGACQVTVTDEIRATGGLRDRVIVWKLKSTGLSDYRFDQIKFLDVGQTEFVPRPAHGKEVSALNRRNTRNTKFAYSLAISVREKWYSSFEICLIDPVIVNKD